MTACDLQPDDERFHGHLNGRDLLELLKMLHRTCSSGVLHLDAGPNRASLCIDQGAIRAAFFNQLAGSPALARIILIGETDFRFELGTAHTVASFAVNIAKDTALILATVERMLDDHGGRTAREPAAAPPHAPPPAGSDPRAITAIDTGLEPAPDQTGTIRIAAFHPPEPGTTLGKCELLGEIGRGASSVVYRARHSSLCLDVVVKVLMQHGDDANHHRLLTANEAHLLARLNHPNILRIFDFTDSGLHPHLVMEHVDGPSLAELITRSQRLEPTLALPLICQVIEALAYAH